MKKRIAREAAMCILYEYSVAGDPNPETLEIMGDVLSADQLTGQNKIYVDRIVAVLKANEELIDGHIEKYSVGWKTDRISKVDLAILRLAITEMLFFDNIPVKVSVNEAVEMAKKYSIDKSPKFVNGLLGAFIKNELNLDENK